MDIDFNKKGKSQKMLHLKIVNTYIVSTLALVPCILPIIVPAFEFFTQPVMPSSSAFSRAHFVNEQPVEYVTQSFNRWEMLINGLDIE